MVYYQNEETLQYRDGGGVVGFLILKRFEVLDGVCFTRGSNATSCLTNDKRGFGWCLFYKGLKRARWMVLGCTCFGWCLFYKGLKLNTGKSIIICVLDGVCFTRVSNQVLCWLFYQYWFRIVLALQESQLCISNSSHHL